MLFGELAACRYLKEYLLIGEDHFAFQVEIPVQLFCDLFSFYVAIIIRDWKKFPLRLSGTKNVQIWGKKINFPNIFANLVILVGFVNFLQ